MGYIRVIMGFYGDNGKENGNYYLGFRDRTCGTWGSYDKIPKAIFYLFNGDYNPKPLGQR